MQHPSSLVMPLRALKKHLHISSSWNHAFPTSCCFFSLFSLKRRPSESMTKEVIPHNVTIFPCIKEVTLRYWNQRCATWGFPFYLGEIKGSRSLPTNSHLAPLPCVIYPCLMRAKAQFLQLKPTQAPSCTTCFKKKAAKNMPTSANIWKIFLKVGVSWWAWFMTRSIVSSSQGFVSLPSCHWMNYKEF